jgi:hypothetical protein
MQSAEDAFLDRLARGQIVAQDEYDQMCDSLPLETIAAALARRFTWTGESRTLVEAARLYALAGFLYEALEVCSRSPHVYGLRQIVLKSLPAVRSAYPGARLVGKLLDEALLVIDLETGKIVRFPPILPATMCEDGVA